MHDNWFKTLRHKPKINKMMAGSVTFSISLTVNDLPKGIYFITGENENGSIKHKLIVE